MQEPLPIAFDVPIREMQFVWVTDHYDCHLTGLCRHNGSLCRFEQENAFTDDPVVTYSIYPLTRVQKAMWLAHKKAFELCVGYHWSYPHRKNGGRYKHPLPQWVRPRLSNLYYATRRALAR